MSEGRTERYQVNRIRRFRINSVCKTVRCLFLEQKKLSLNKLVGEGSLGANVDIENAMMCVTNIQFP